MPIEITFTLEIGLEADTANGMRVTLYRQDEYTTPGTSQPIPTLDELGQEIIADEKVSFPDDAADGMMILLDDNSLGRTLFRSWSLTQEEFKDPQGIDAWRINIRIRQLFELTYSVNDLRELLPETPFLVDLTAQNLNGTEGLRITSLTLNQLGIDFELTGEGQSLATYDPATGVSTVGFPFDFRHTFRIRAFHGLPLYQRLVAIDTQQAIITPAHTGIGSNILNAFTNFILSFSSEDITHAWDSNIQERIDDAMEGIAPDDDVRTITLPEVKTLQDGIAFTPIVWLPSLPEEAPADDDQPSDTSDKSLPAGCLTVILDILRRLLR